MNKPYLLIGIVFCSFLWSCEDPPVVIEDKAPTITVGEATADIDEFKKLLDDHSSYVQLSTYDYVAALTALKTKIITAGEPVRVTTLSKDLGIILAEVGDRHSHVKYDDLSDIDFPLIKKRFPVTITSLLGAVVALKKGDEDGEYSKIDPIYYKIKAINDVPALDFLAKYAYRPKKAPETAKLTRSIWDIRRLGERMYLHEEFSETELKITYEGGGETKDVVYPLTDDTKTYYSKVKESMRNLRDSIEDDKDFSGIFSLLGGDVAYVRIPKMYDYDDVPGLEARIAEMLAVDIKDTRAMIIDLRYNTGGTRDIIASFAPYLVQTYESPWVANVAHLRSETTAPIPIGSLTSRLLHPRDSDKFTDDDRDAIDEFAEGFAPVRAVPAGKFRGPYYMVFNANRTPYEGDVYVLVNDETFSAASVFAAAFADLKDVTIVGMTTDGSSGNSKTWDLSHSDIEVKLSTMVSYQRNGKTLDGNGTVPTIKYKRDMKYILGDFDMFMVKLSGHIGIPL